MLAIRREIGRSILPNHLLGMKSRLIHQPPRTYPAPSRKRKMVGNRADVTKATTNPPTMINRTAQRSMTHLETGSSVLPDCPVGMDFRRIHQPVKASAAPTNKTTYTSNMCS